MGFFHAELFVLFRIHRLLPFLPPGCEGGVLPELREDNPVLPVLLGVRRQQRLRRLLRREELPRLAPALSPAFQKTSLDIFTSRLPFSFFLFS